MRDRRAFLLPLALLLLALPAGAGPLGDRTDDSAAGLVARIRPLVVKVEGIDAGGRLLPSAGVVVGDGGHVVTWSRMASPGWNAVVIRPGGRKRAAKVAARDPRSGLTLLELERPFERGLATAPGFLGAGDPVVTAGYPFGGELADSGAAVSQAVIAQARREKDGEEPSLYLLSGAVNPGDFGGPLVDRHGRLAGLLVPGRDEPSGLSSALPVAVVAARFAGTAGAKEALAPAGPSEDGDGVEWPVQDALRVAAQAVAPAVPSLVMEPEEEGRETWSATGVLVSDTGLIVTTRENLVGAKSVTAVLADGREFAATRLGSDERIGIALLSIDAPDLPAPASLARELPRVGRFVAAVGNANGREVRNGPLVTIGIVGARNRRDRRYGALHTDAAVNRANAGGALVDLEGRVVGILTTFGGTTLTDLGANSGIGFAIPSPAVSDRLPALARGETIAWRPGYLGVNLDLNVPPENGGVVILEVQPGEAAEAAGLKPGDVIVGADDHTIGGYDDLRRIFLGFEEGQEIRLRLRRDGKDLEVLATLGAPPESWRR